MAVLYVLDNMCFSVFSGRRVHIFKVILSLRLCLGILGRAGIVHYLSCFCAELVCNCIPRRCAALGLPDRKRRCLTEAVEDTSSSDTAMQMSAPTEHLQTHEIVSDSDNSCCADWTQTWHAGLALDLWAQTLTFPCPLLGEGALLLNKTIPMNKKWFTVGQSLPVLVALFFCWCIKWWFNFINTWWVL